MNSQSRPTSTPEQVNAFPKCNVSKTPPECPQQTPQQQTGQKQANQPTAVPLPWMSWQVGERVVVRRREADGLYDALGELLEVCPDHVTVQTRKGPVRVEAYKMVTGKRVPPAPKL